MDFVVLLQAVTSNLIDNDQKCLGLCLLILTFRSTPFNQTEAQ